MAGSKEQVSKSEQILPNLSMAIDYDEPLRTQADFLSAFNSALNNQCYLMKYQKTKNVYVYKHDGKTEFFLAGAITYLSNPHPIFKKRFQLKKWFKQFYSDFSRRPGVNIHLIGVYQYKGLILFVDFLTDDYMQRKLNSSAAHVYSNDLYQGIVNGHFEKIDKNGNHINVLTKKTFIDFLNGKKVENPIFDLFNKFNSSFNFGSWIKADDAISEMKNADWYQWKGTEWPGWFLEYKFSSFIVTENCAGQMIYIGNIKDKSLLDFDIFFPKANYYGDLKASDIDKKEAPGNDQDNVLEAINKYGKLWYVIYEHKTIKDSTKNNEMAIRRMNLIGKDYKPGDEISYAAKMKHSVEFQRMKIFELNRINLNETLSAFNQGHQPDGKSRKPKFLINKSNIENFIVFSYDYNQPQLEYDYGTGNEGYLMVADSDSKNN